MALDELVWFFLSVSSHNHRVFVAFSAPKGIIDYNEIHCGIEVLCMKHYKKRIADHILKRKLEGKGAVLIEGPKWCGKTTTAEQIAASILCQRGVL